ncbi:MAG: glycosyltransferase involved in cell wall biosynthesis [Pseudohongiellaceae bacterium]|jgi:glycosyltransferase involved in cell wall biosynthesis
MSNSDNIIMVSADRSVVAGERGPFYYMLESFHRHWGRVDVIGTRPGKVEHKTMFGNVHLHHPTTGKLAQAKFIADTGRRLASERPYTVITSHDYNPFYNGLGSWRISRATGIPYVAEIHHVPGFPRAASFRERIDAPMTRLYAGWAKTRAAGFRVVNGIELPRLLGGWGVPAERIHVLPSLYLDRETFSPAAPGDQEAGATPECDLLFVGRLVPNKGVPAILEGLAELERRGLSGLRLRLVGRGPELQAVKAFAEQHGAQDRIENIEWVPDAAALAEVYRKARFLVCASTSEGGPRVVAEAMACGTPVVSTEVGIVTELIRHGDNGLLFDGSGKHLADVLEPLLSDPTAEQSMRSRLRPEDLDGYEGDTVIARLADGLKEIATAARARRG